MVVGGGECLLRQMPNAYRIKTNAIASRADHIETLILGASHSLISIRPSQLRNSAYNMAHVSQTIEVDAKVLETYLPMLPALKNVVACVDAAILFDPPIAEGDEGFRATYYNLYTPLPRLGTVLRHDLEIASYQSAKLKLSALISGETAPQIDSLGWYAGYTPERTQTEMFDAASVADRARHDTQHDTTYLSQNREALQRIYDLCKQRGVTLYLICTPVVPSYTASLPAWARQAVAETLLPYQHAPQVRVLDYADDPRFDERDFYTPDHLNTTGAEKFTNILREDTPL